MGVDFNAELGLGFGIERLSVGPHTHKESNSRGDGLKQWLILQKIVAPNTMYKKTLEKLVTYRTLEGAEKQLDNILVNRKYLRYGDDA